MPLTPYRDRGGLNKETGAADSNRSRTMRVEAVGRRPRMIVAIALALLGGAGVALAAPSGGAAAKAGGAAAAKAGARAKYKAAAQLAGSGAHEKALLVIDEGLARAPADLTLLRLKGSVLMTLHDWPGALGAYQAFLD